MLIQENELSQKEMVHLLNLAECAVFTAIQEKDFMLCYANSRFYDLIQYTSSEFKEKHGNRVMELLDFDEKQRIRNLIARQMAVGGKLHLEFRISRKDGTRPWIALVADSRFVEGKKIMYCSVVDITKQKRNLEELYKAKREVDIITDNIPGGMVRIRVSDFTLLYANDSFYRRIGYNRAEFMSTFGNVCDKLIYPEDIKIVSNALKTAIDNHDSLGVEYRIIDRNGDILWSYARGCRVEDQNGSPVFLCVIMDVTSRKLLQEKLEEQIRCSQYLHDFKKDNEWTYVIHEDTVYRRGHLDNTYSQETVIENFLRKEHLNQVFKPEDIPRFLKEMEQLMEKPMELESVYLLRDNTGEYRLMDVKMVSACVNDEEKPDRVFGETRIAAEPELLFAQAQTPSKKERIINIAAASQSKEADTVTDLVSFSDFIYKMELKLEEERAGKNYAIMCCDLNEYHKLSYHYGLSSSNEILKSMAKVLREVIPEDNLCRVRGDYFIGLLTYEDNSQLLKTFSSLQRRLGKMEDDFSYKTYGTTTGVYMLSDTDTDILKVVENADLARRSIKGQRGNHYAIYTDDLERNQFKEEEIIQDIDTAIRNHTIEICYQPRIFEDKEHIMGCKAIPRIQRRTGEYLPIEDMKRYLDRTPNIQKIVFYVLSQVCKTQGVWKEQGKKIFPISLDITQGQLCGQGAIEHIDQILAENNISPTEILFEIQEKYFRDITPQFQTVLEKLNSKGYRIIISRFASDHIAVNSMRTLPIHAIKFHGEFFQDKLNDEKEYTIYKKIVEMAKELGMRVSCGSIQTEYQEKMAKSIGCDIFEGDIYYGIVRSDVYEKCFLEE